MSNGKGKELMVRGRTTYEPGEMITEQQFEPNWFEKNPPVEPTCAADERHYNKMKEYIEMPDKMGPNRDKFTRDLYDIAGVSSSDLEAAVLWAKYFWHVEYVLIVPKQRDAMEKSWRSHVERKRSGKSHGHMRVRNEQPIPSMEVNRKLRVKRAAEIIRETAEGHINSLSVPSRKANEADKRAYLKKKVCYLVWAVRETRIMVNEEWAKTFEINWDEKLPPHRLPRRAPWDPPPPPT